jgi:hypothetical protein
VLAVTAVGKELTRDARYLRLATRICAELGAQVVKTYYCAEDFDTVAAGRHRAHRGHPDLPARPRQERLDADGITSSRD